MGVFAPLFCKPPLGNKRLFVLWKSGRRSANHVELVYV